MPAELSALLAFAEKWGIPLAMLLALWWFQRQDNVRREGREDQRNAQAIERSVTRENQAREDMLQREKLQREDNQRIRDLLIQREAELYALLRANMEQQRSTDARLGELASAIQANTTMTAQYNGILTNMIQRYERLTGGEVGLVHPAMMRPEDIARARSMPPGTP